MIVPELPCRDDAEVGIDGYVAVVEDELAGRSEAPLVVGSSLGAVTACVFAARQPARALITVGGLIPLPGRRVGEDSAEMMQPAFASAVDPNPDRSTTFRPESAIELVFHESPPELAREAASRLRRQAARPFTEPCPFEALPDIPRRGIVVAPQDRLMRGEWLSRAVRERLDVEPTVLDGDHAPMLSEPDRLTELLLAPIDGT